MTQVEATKNMSFKQKWNMNKFLIKKNKVFYYMLAPYFILFFVFTVFPVLMSMGLSLSYFNMLEPPRFIGFNNYLRLFLDDDVFMTAIKNTFVLAIITGPVSYLLAFVFAWLINELPRRLRTFMTLIFYAPSLSGAAFTIWLLIFSGDIYGFANAYLIRFNIIREPILWLQNPEYALPILIIVQLWMSLGVGFLAFIAGLQNCDRTLYEAGAIDGINNRWQELWFITLPQMVPQLMFGAVMQITGSFGIGLLSKNLLGFPSTDYSGHTIINHLDDFGMIRYELGYASAIATVLFLFMIFANKFIQKILRKVGT
ncbi:carbohydrate ABC transporter permease [Peloplasma aerotolerans]|uniref:Sugar ABC transporter permease n=1 Tax=Peloplasma aerotolerans TaxID=3044389 RepID=A0AAW6U3F6_9MOLU|nr:sugar ABC transporter permease [Mariniplasma sp. M4Ah]MDI6452432.1 sugar ABC transporter permease [Mariniplasma sp. M4Ah]